MLKKLLLLIVILLGSCSSSLTGEFVRISERRYNNLFHATMILMEDEDILSDAKIAQSIGDILIESIVGDSEFKKLNGVDIDEDEKNNTWVIRRYSDVNVYRIVIKKSDSKVLEVTSGEKDFQSILKEDIVTDAKVAQRIGDVIIESIVEDSFDEIQGVDVYYYAKDDVWIIDRYDDAFNQLGGAYLCAIRKSDSKIVKVWTSF